MKKKKAMSDLEKSKQEYESFKLNEAPPWKTLIKAQNYIDQLEKLHKRMTKFLIHYAKEDYQFYINNNFTREESLKMIFSINLLQEITDKPIGDIIND